MTLLAFTRPGKRIGESVALAESMGFDVLAAPSLEIMDGYPEDFAEAEKLIAAGGVDIMVFGSATAVEECVRVWGGRFPALAKMSVAVSIGPNTAAALRNAGIEPAMSPDDHSSYGLVELLKEDAKGKRIMLVRSDMGSEVLKSGLVEAGADVTEFAAYRLKTAGATPEMDAIMDALLAGKVDVLAFTSPMSAASFVAMLSGRCGDAEAMSALRGCKVAAIGTPTALKLEELGRRPDIVPSKTTFPDMLEAIRASAA
jgi:uroporphyrinogen-III synthase